MKVLQIIFIAIKTAFFKVYIKENVIRGIGYMVSSKLSYPRVSRLSRYEDRLMWCLTVYAHSFHQILL